HIKSRHSSSLEDDNTELIASVIFISLQTISIDLLCLFNVIDTCKDKLNFRKKNH
ncbi:unnamed protein product, partial [Brugia timori]|uniref:Ovule protein n=1 Tax=Brugia timori TaxID=42155 RepID=A0A0R3RAD9_9BILA